MRWADRILTVSHAAKADLAALFKLDPARVGVVPEAADGAFRPMGNGPESRQILDRYRHRRLAAISALHVGGLEPLTRTCALGSDRAFCHRHTTPMPTSCSSAT